MIKSFCGKYPCPGVCSRVEHCPAGKERVRWLWFHKRVSRAQSETRPPDTRPCPPGVDPDTGEISEPRAYSRILNQPERKKPSRFLPVSGKRQATPIYGKLLRNLGGKAVLLAFVMLMVIILMSGFIANGPNLVPYYRTDDVYTPPYWMQDR